MDKIKLQMIKGFLKNIFSKSKGYIEIRKISPRKRTLIYRSFTHISELENLKLPDDRDILFSLCPRSRQSGTKADVLEVPVLWADIDRPDTIFTDNWSIMHGDIPEPSIIVKSGKGYHLYWRLIEPVKKDLHRVEGILRNLALRLNADSATQELARLLRLPWTFNTKYNPPVPVSIISDSNRLYSIEQFSLFTSDQPLYHPNKAVSRTFYSLELLNYVLENCRFIKWASTDQASVKEPLWWAMITNLVCFENYRTVIHEFSCQYPRYQKRETDYKIKRALQVSPHTCLYIYRNGFHECLKCSHWGTIVSPVSLVTRVNRKIGQRK